LSDRAATAWLRRWPSARSSRAEHTRIGDESVARLRAAGREAEADIRTGDAAAEIIGVAAELKADLVVLGSHGRTGLTRVLLGSVAQNVLHGGTSSVLIVREAIPSQVV